MYFRALLLSWGTTDPHGEKLMVIEQVSWGIHPEGHSRRIEVSRVLIHLLFCLLYLAETWVMAVYNSIYHHDGHICVFYLSP